MTKLQQERRSFQMDKQLLIDVIKRQAGSLWKAISEAIMNAVDAGATTCDIELTREMLIIKDNGKGFRSRADVENFFEIFGKPHDAAEDKTFGRFRMGRGQLFAFGANTWRSNTFQMSVNINEEGLDYHLTENLEKEHGCAINVRLYKTLSHTHYANILEEIANNGKYIGIPVTLNGKAFPTDRSQVRWDIEMEEADIKLRSNQDLRIYNQGILVKSFYRHIHGVGGDVVTKVPIQVNFARNDIMEDCPVWGKILRKLRRHANGQATTTRESQGRATRTSNYERRATVKLTEEDRRRLVNQTKDGILTHNQYKGARIWQRCTKPGDVTVRTIWNECEGRVTMTPAADTRGHRYSERRWRQEIAQIENNKLAVVLPRLLLDRFNLSDLGKMVALSNTNIYAHDKYHLQYIPWAKLMKTLQSDSQVIDTEELNQLELTVLCVLREAKEYLFADCPLPEGTTGADVEDRVLQVGRSPLESWTDGESMIGFSRDYIQRVGIGFGAWYQYGYRIMHESLHNERSDSRHGHGPKFYANYHQWCAGGTSLPAFLHRCMSITSRVAHDVGLTLTQQEFARLDKFEEMQEEAAAQAARTSQPAPEPEASQPADVLQPVPFLLPRDGD